MTENLKKKIEDYNRDRETCLGSKARLSGRLEEAQSRLKDVKARCIEKGIDPDALDQAIAQETEKLEGLLADRGSLLEKAKSTLESINASGKK